MAFVNEILYFRAKTKAFMQDCSFLEFELACKPTLSTAHTFSINLDFLFPPNTYVVY